VDPIGRIRLSLKRDTAHERIRLTHVTRIFQLWSFSKFALAIGSEFAARYLLFPCYAPVIRLLFRQCLRESSVFSECCVLASCIFPVLYRSNALDCTLRACRRVAPTLCLRGLCTTHEQLISSTRS